MGEPGYLRCRSVAEARRVAAEIDVMLTRTLPHHTAEEVERERETLKLREAFVRVDILKIHDDYSLTGCRRNAPEGS